VTKATSRGTSTTSTSIRSSMASYHACATGRIHRFIGMCGKVCCRMTGQVPAQMEQVSVNGPNDLCSPHEPTGRREAPPDDRLRDMRGIRHHPGYRSAHPGYSR
jgi:hypothetical protein